MHGCVGKYFTQNYVFKSQGLGLRYINGRIDGEHLNQEPVIIWQGLDRLRSNLYCFRDQSCS